MRLRDMAAIITGGTSGIGQALALAFAAEGADLVIASRRLARTEKVAARVRRFSRRAFGLQVDVANPVQVREMVATTVRELGHLDILVNCAGARYIAPLLDTSEERWTGCAVLPPSAAGLSLRRSRPPPCSSPPTKPAT